MRSTSALNREILPSSTETPLGKIRHPRGTKSKPSGPRSVNSSAPTQFDLQLADDRRPGCLDQTHRSGNGKSPVSECSSANDTEGSAGSTPRACPLGGEWPVCCQTQSSGTRWCCGLLYSWVTLLALQLRPRLPRRRLLRAPSSTCPW